MVAPARFTCKNTLQFQQLDACPWEHLVFSILSSKCPKQIVDFGFKQCLWRSRELLLLSQASNAKQFHTKKASRQPLQASFAVAFLLESCWAARESKETGTSAESENIWESKRNKSWPLGIWRLRSYPDSLRFVRVVPQTIVKEDGKGCSVSFHIKCLPTKMSPTWKNVTMVHAARP